MLQKIPPVFRCHHDFSLFQVAWYGANARHSTLYCFQPLFDCAWGINALVHKPKSIESLASAWHPQCVLLFGPGFLTADCRNPKIVAILGEKEKHLSFLFFFPGLSLLFPFSIHFPCVLCSASSVFYGLIFSVPSFFLQFSFHPPFISLSCSLFFLALTLIPWYSFFLCLHHDVIKVRKTMKNQLLKSGTKEQTAKLELLCWHSKFQFKAQFSSPWPLKMGKTQKQKSHQTRC